MFNIALTWNTIKNIGYGVLLLVVVGTVWGVKAEWDSGRAAIKQVHAITAVSKTQTTAVAKADKTVAASDTKAQAKIVTRYKTLLKEVPTYVTKTTPCIPWSVVRLHDAAVLGVDPSTLPLPAGQSDDDCSDVESGAFVDTVITNYRAAQANAQQLNDLIADIAAREQAVAPAAAQKPVAPVAPPF